jgi:hypothetical protein
VSDGDGRPLLEVEVFMRSVFVFVVCVCALAALSIGCSDDADPVGTGGTGGTGGSGGTTGTGGSSGGSGEAPVITRVEWNWTDDNCMVGVSRAVVVTVFATDDDTDALSLTYSGEVSDCTPDIDTDLTVLDCTTDHIGLRVGTVTVTDPEQNLDTVGFMFDPCESGEVCEGGDPCP